MATPALTLEERIKSVRAEIDSLIDGLVAEEAERIKGVPRDVLRNCLIAGEHCQCRAFAALAKKGLA